MHTTTVFEVFLQNLVAVIIQLDWSDVAATAIQNLPWRIPMSIIYTVRKDLLTIRREN
jgi:hypothetical protein